MSITEFPINIYNEIVSHLQSLSDPDEIDDHNCETVFRIILTFSSSTVTPGVKIHQQLMDLWLNSTDSNMSYLINNTVLQLYNFHKPGTHPLIWSPIEPQDKALHYFKTIIHLVSGKDIYTQQHKNAVMILKYLFIIFEQDFKKNQANSFCMFKDFINAGRTNLTKNLIINSIFECLHNVNYEITDSLLILQCFIDLILSIELLDNLVENEIMQLIIKKFERLSIENQEIFLQSFPEGKTKLLMLDELIRIYGILKNNKYNHLSDILPNPKKLCKYYYSFEPKSQEYFYIFLYILSHLAQLIFNEETLFPKTKVRRLSSQFLSKMIKQIPIQNKTIKRKTKLQLLKLDLLTQGYCKE